MTAPSPSRRPAYLSLISSKTTLERLVRRKPPEPTSDGHYDCRNTWRICAPRYGPE
jgi:hypothetical protein